MDEAGCKDFSPLLLILLELPLDNAAAGLIIGHDLDLADYFEFL